MRYGKEGKMDMVKYGIWEGRVDGYGKTWDMGREIWEWRKKK